MLTLQQQALVQRHAVLLQVVSAALMASPIIALSVLPLLSDRRPPEAASSAPAVAAVPWFSVAAAAALAIAAVAAPVLRAVLARVPREAATRRSVAAGENADEGDEAGGAGPLLNLFLTRQIVSLGVLEGAALVGIAAYHSEGRTWVLGLVALALVLMAAWFPRPSALADWLDRELESSRQTRQFGSR